MDELNEKQKELADQVAKMLAASPLDEGIKNDLLENLDKMPERVLTRLLESLSREEEILESIALDMEFWENEQGENWKKLENEQAKTAESIVDQFVTEIVEETGEKTTEVK